VLTAANGHSCLQMARAGMPHLAMLDISMPDMTGWEIANELRAMEESRSLRIVMVSANAHEYSPGADGNSPHDAFMMKPVDIQLMLERVGEMLGLEWIYEAEPVAVRVAEPTTDLSADSLHHIEDLYRLGRIGHVRGIEAKLVELEAEDPGAVTLTAHLRTLVCNFDLKRYMQVVGALRGRAQNSAP
jgi:CheY-like chemotaxis protein